MKKLSLLILGGILLLTSCGKEDQNLDERFYFRNDGADLAVQVDGNVASGTFILLLHGGPGGGAAAYNSGLAMDMLEERYAIVYMDQRGNGASQGNYDKDDLTLEQNSKDVYALSKFLKARYGQNISLFLMGHSWGGITTAHALIHTKIQEELKGWIEVDGAHDFTKNNIEAVKLFLEVGNDQIAKGKEVSYWTEVVNRVSEIDTNNISDDDEGYMNSTGFEAEGKLDEINEPSQEGTGAAYDLFVSPDFSLAVWMSNNFGNPILNEDSKDNPLTDRLHEITIPSQFLWGKFDFVVPPALGVSGFNLVGTNDKELVIFDHSGHSPMVNEPRLFAQEVIDFVELYK